MLLLCFKKCFNPQTTQKGGIKMKRCLIFILLPILLVALSFPISFAGEKDSAFLKQEVMGNGKDKTGKQLVVAIDAADLVSEYVINLVEYCKFLLETGGAKVIVTNSNFDLQTQDGNIDDFIQMGVDAVILHAVDSEGSSPAVARLNKAGIPVICIIRHVKPAKMDLFISTSNNVRTGEKAAEALLKKAGGKEASIATFQGYMGASDAYLRAEGIDKIISANPNLKKVGDYPCDWLPDKAEKAMSDVLNAYPDIWGIISHCDCMAPGIYSALRQKGRAVSADNPKHINWAGIDGAPYGLQMIREGVMDVGVEQSPLTVGLLAAKAVLTRVSKGLSLEEKSVDVPTSYVTKENVDDPGLWGNYDIKKVSPDYLWPRTQEIWSSYLIY
jgi:ABC-type sugar transport system substrate-binding protein